MIKVCLFSCFWNHFQISSRLSILFYRSINNEKMSLPCTLVILCIIIKNKTNKKPKPSVTFRGKNSIPFSWTTSEVDLLFFSIFSPLDFFWGASVCIFCSFYFFLSGTLLFSLTTFMKLLFIKCITFAIWFRNIIFYIQMLYILNSLSLLFLLKIFLLTFIFKNLNLQKKWKNNPVSPINSSVRFTS